MPKKRKPNKCYLNLELPKLNHFSVMPLSALIESIAWRKANIVTIAKFSGGSPVAFEPYIPSLVILSKNFTRKSIGISFGPGTSINLI